MRETTKRKFCEKHVRNNSTIIIWRSQTSSPDIEDFLNDPAAVTYLFMQKPNFTNKGHLRSFKSDFRIMGIFQSSRCPRCMKELLKFNPVVDRMLSYGLITRDVKHTIWNSYLFTKYKFFTRPLSTQVDDRIVSLGLFNLAWTVSNETTE